MRNLLAFLLLIPLLAIAKVSPGMGGIANRTCLAEFDTKYSSVKERVPNSFCLCYSGGFLREMTSDRRDALFKLEQRERRLLRTKADLIQFGFGDIQERVESQCTANPRAYSNTN